MESIKMCTVEEFMGEGSELKKSDLEALKDWLKKQPHLPQMSEFDLALFLHSNYCRIEPTKITIDSYFTVKTHLPEFFSCRDPLGARDVREIMKVVCHLPLPGSTPEGYKVMYGKLIDFIPAHYVHADAVKLLCMSLDLWLYTAGVSASPGHVLILDMDGMQIGHVARLNPMIFKKFFYYLQSALPIRLKSLHLVNTVPFVDVIISMAKPFMKKELMDMLQLHSNVETLGKYVPIDLLPNEQGGKAGPLNDLWQAEIKNIEANRAWFQDEEMRKVNETVRPGKQKNVTDLFGVEGSFKKLEVD